MRKAHAALSEIKIPNASAQNEDDILQYIKGRGYVDHFLYSFICFLEFSYKINICY